MEKFASSGGDEVLTCTKCHSRPVSPTREKRGGDISFGLCICEVGATKEEKKGFFVCTVDLQIYSFEPFSNPEIGILFRVRRSGFNEDCAFGGCIQCNPGLYLD